MNIPNVQVNAGKLTTGIPIDNWIGAWRLKENQDQRSRFRSLAKTREDTWNRCSKPRVLGKISVFVISKSDVLVSEDKFTRVTKKKFFKRRDDYIYVYICVCVHVYMCVWARDYSIGWWIWCRVWERRVKTPCFLARATLRWMELLPPELYEIPQGTDLLSKWMSEGNKAWMTHNRNAAFKTLSQWLKWCVWKPYQTIVMNKLIYI